MQAAQQHLRRWKAPKICFLSATLVVCLTVPISGQSPVPKESVETLLGKANQGDAKSQTDLGIIYLNGYGVPKDTSAALHWFQLAAAQDEARSQMNLGVMYLNGRGVAQDSTTALQWLRLAANQRFAGAQLLLGDLYNTGDRGVARDFVQAYMWMLLAVSNAPGNKSFEGFRDEVGGKMTPDQIATAQRLARDWVPQTNGIVNPQATEPPIQDQQNAPPSPLQPSASTLPEAQTNAAADPTPPPSAPPRGEEPRQSTEGSPANGDGDLGWLGWLIGAVVVLAIIIRAVWRSSHELSAEPTKLGRDRDGYEEARTGIPHVGFKWIKDGFEVAIRNKNSDYRQYAGILKKRGFGKDVNQIVATRNELIINGKRLRNTECRGFEARGFEAPLGGPQNPEHVLGYYYGTEFYEIPGVWSAKEADEIVLSLNLHWRALFSQASTGTQASTQANPEDLRNTRPTDF